MTVTNASLAQSMYARGLHLKHLHAYRIQMLVTNGVGLTTSCFTTSVLMDLTPPDPGYIQVVQRWSAQLQTIAPTSLQQCEFSSAAPEQFQSTALAIRILSRK